MGMAAKKRNSTNKPSDEQIAAGLKIADDDRSARGLGWEHARRGLPIDGCPYPTESWQAVEFRRGWLGKHDSESGEH